MENFDLGCYIVSCVLFLLGGFSVPVTVGNPARSIRFEWLAFGALVLSLLF